MKLPERILSAHAARRLRAHLRGGGLVAYPTESCYGLGCVPTDPHGLRRLIRLKKRPQHKGMIVIGAALPQLQPLLERLPEATRQGLNEVWPAAKTFLLPAAASILPQLRGRGRRTLAVRVPAHDGARALCAQLHMPLVSTSANRAGGRPCRSEREVRRRFGDKVWCVGGRIGKARSPSRIIDWATGQVLR